MQKIIFTLLILWGVTAQAQKCYKYECAMRAGEQYLNDSAFDKALVEFQAAQIAARECGMVTEKPGEKLKKVFEGLQKQKKNLEDANRRAQNNLKVANREREISPRALGYFFKNKSDSVTWVPDTSTSDYPTGKFGIIDRKGRILPGGFNWSNTNPFAGEYITATNKDRIYFINHLGKIISRGYHDILRTEFPMFYFACQGYNHQGSLIFYNGHTFETLVNVTTEFNIEKSRPEILPFRSGKNFGFIDKENHQFRPPIYDNLLMSAGSKSPPVIVAAGKNDTWELVDLHESKVLNSAFSTAQLEQSRFVQKLKESSREKDSLAWISWPKEDYYGMDVDSVSGNIEDDGAELKTKGDSVSLVEYYAIKRNCQFIFHQCDSLINTSNSRIDSVYLNLYESIVQDGLFKQNTEGNPDSTLVDSVSSKKYAEMEDKYADLLYLHSRMLDELQRSVNQKTEVNYPLEARYPKIGADTSCVNPPRFRKIKDAKGFGIVNSSNDTILRPVYDVIRYFSGDSIFYLGHREIIKGNYAYARQYRIIKKDTAYVCQLFNASTGLFFSFQSSADSTHEWRDGIWLNGASDKEYSSKYDYSVYVSKNAKAFPAFNKLNADLAIDNQEIGLIMKGRFFESSFIFLDGKTPNLRNKVSRLGYLNTCKEGVYIDINNS